MDWSGIMNDIYRFWGEIAQWLEQALHRFNTLWASFFCRACEILVGMGVPEQQCALVVYGILYLLATLLVLLLVWRLLRRKRRGAAKVPADVGEKAAGESAAAEPLSVVERMRRGLAKTHTALVGRIDGLFGGSAVDDAFLEELEEILITADFGVKTTTALVDAFKQRVAVERAQGVEQLRAILKQELLELMRLPVAELDVERQHPMVMMVIGVNGVGKTTTIGKLAQQYSKQGKKVVLGAADTFRAAAADQLSIWAERSGCDIIRHEEGSDPAAVAFDSAKAAVARDADILILDTAGRLHTKVNLMEEMKKIHRVLGREIDAAPHETLLVLDATTGQNALAQARQFCQAVKITGVIITKLDGTAKGGMAVAIATELGLPIRYIGVGEGVDDLRVFDPDLFVDALFENR